MTGTAHDLLGYATGILDGTLHVPAAQQTRAAAHLARQALEEIVPELCDAVGAQLPPRTPMRSRLIILQALGSPDCARAARAAWTGLSRACHRHAYELPPTHTEIHSMIKHVADVLTAADALPANLHVAARPTRPSDSAVGSTTRTAENAAP